jgi:hypothetical protein
MARVAAGARRAQTTIVQERDRGVDVERRTTGNLQAPSSIRTIAADRFGEVEHRGTRGSLGLVEQPAMAPAALPGQPRYHLIELDCDSVRVQTLVVQRPVPTRVRVRLSFVGHDRVSAARIKRFVLVSVHG